MMELSSEEDHHGMYGLLAFSASICACIVNGISAMAATLLSSAQYAYLQVSIIIQEIFELNVR